MEAMGGVAQGRRGVPGGPTRARGVRRGVVAGLASVITAMIAAGSAFAYWTTTATGSGQAQAASGAGASITFSSATVTNKLYPGGSGDVSFTVANPNSFPVQITGLTAGTITSGNTSCDTSGSGVTFNRPASFASTTYRVPANASAYAITISGGASMAITSDTNCQSKTFTIPLSGTAVATS